MPEPTQSENQESSQDTPKRATELNVIINPQDTVGLALQPVYISLGIKTEGFKKEVGGTAS